MDEREYEFFNILNDVVLLKFELLTPWEKNFITDLNHKAVARQTISTKQKQLALKISKKAYKAKKKKISADI